MQTEQQSATLLEASRIAQDFQIRKSQVESVMQLLDEGCTVPYLARYAREKTGGLPEDILRRLAERIHEYRQHQDRKKTILKNLEAQGKLTPELKEAIQAAETPRRLDDLYLPFKPKKKSTSQDARDRGLEPLALAIWNRDPAVENLLDVVNGMVAPEKLLITPEDVLNGAQQILAEMIADLAIVRAPARPILWETGNLVVTKNDSASEEKARDYRDYHKFSESIKTIPAHRILLINRGERENVLKVRVEADSERIKLASLKALNLQDHPHQAFLLQVADDAITRLLLPSLEKEVRRELTDIASDHAIGTAARNLHSMLMQHPLVNKRLLAIDPGMRNGCRVAVLSEDGELLEETSIFPHSPQYQRKESKHALEKMIRKHGVQVIAIGNGTASRDTEVLVSDLIHAFDCKRKGLPIPEDPVMVAPAAAKTEKEVAKPTAPEVSETPAVTAEASETPASVSEVSESTPEATTITPETPVPETATTPTATPETPAPVEAPLAAPVEAPQVVLEDLSALPEPDLELAYAVINEAGSNDYSTSPIAREEFPELDPTVRAAISIGRRLQDPLRELVKLDPQQIGIGVYQQDVKVKKLKETLETVIESCVNDIGVDLNKATISLLRFVSGLNPILAREIVDHRSRNGVYKKREDLLQVSTMTPEKYRQAAAFLQISGGEEPLDATRLHPEQYVLLKQLLSEYGFITADLSHPEKNEKIKEKLKTFNLQQLSERWKVSPDTVKDVLDAVFVPTTDPRLHGPVPILRKAMLQFEELAVGQELQGTVLNVVQFGAFVDVGLRDSGLVHISQMANRFIRSPFDVVSVGDIVKCWVLKIDTTAKKVSLTMIDPHPPARQERRQDQRPPRQEQRSERNDRPAPQGDRPPRPAGQGGGDQPRRGFQPRPGGGQQQGGGRFQRRDQQAPPPSSKPVDVTPPSNRKPRTDKPLPKLSKDALKGKAPLQTFGELMAFFKAKEEPGAPAKPPESAPPQAPEAQTPPEGETPKAE